MLAAGALGNLVALLEESNRRVVVLSEAAPDFETLVWLTETLWEEDLDLEDPWDEEEIDPAVR